jgi:hypothetical protein
MHTLFSKGNEKMLLFQQGKSDGSLAWAWNVGTYVPYNVMSYFIRLKLRGL